MLKKIIYALTLKTIPKLYWSSSHEYNLKPKIVTVLYLIFGLILFGLGEVLIVTANIGVSPWFVLHQGLSFITGYSIGITTFIVSVISLQLFQVIFAILIIGIGSGLYLAANLGPGPRDGLMTGINKQTGLSFSLIRLVLELSVVGLGFWLGGIIGIGTVLYAVGIGYSVSLGLFLVGKFYK